MGEKSIEIKCINDVEIITDKNLKNNVVNIKRFWDIIIILKFMKR